MCRFRIALATCFLILRENDGFMTSPVMKVSRPHFGVPGNCNERRPSCLRMSEVDENIKEEKMMDETVEEMVEEEMKKTKRMSNLRNEKGVDYAPWMNMSEEDEERIKQIMKSKAAARKKRKEQEQMVSGNLLMDSQAQELSGSGLNPKIIDGSVELEWATSSETDTAGFIVKRRQAKTDDFQPIASYKDWGPLVSKGVQGGVYRYFDENVTPGGWVYRITEVDKSGVENDVCQCLVEIQTEGEKRAALFAGVGITLLAIAIFVAGIELDPLQ